MIRYSFLFLILLGSVNSLFAQSNVLKINLPNLTTRQVALHYERAFNDRLSFGVIGGFTPRRNIPGSDLLIGIFIEDPAATGFNFEGDFTKVSIMPELRYYFLKSQDAPAGLYAGLAGRYARNAFGLPFTITDSSNPLTLELDARIHVIGGTLSLGYQFFLADKIALDIYFGGGLAAAPIRLKSSSNVLSSDDYIRVRDEILDELGLNINPERLENWLTNRGLNMAFAVPLPLLRTGFSLGYRF